MQFSGIVSTVTRETIVPSVSDTVLSGNVGLLRTLGNAKTWRSGYRMDIPVKYQKATTGGIVEVGGTLDTSRQLTRIKMNFQPQRLHKPVVVDDIELAVNQGDERVLELLAVEMDSIAQDLMDDLGSYLYTGTGATGLSFDSLLNAADDATNYASYGGQTRSTYTTLKGYYSAAVGALALSDFSTAYDSTQVGAEKPSIILTTPSVFTSYEGLLQPTVRAGYQMGGYPQVTRTGMVSAVQGLRGDIGFDSVFFRGTPLAADEKCTSGKAFFVNEKHFQFFGMDLAGKGLKDYTTFNTSEKNIKGPQAMPIPKGFNFSGLIRGQNQPAQVGHLYYIGNFISDNPRMLGSLHGIS